MSEGIRRVFYNTTTGEKIHEIGRNDDFILPTIDQDIATFTALSERNRDTFDVIELPFGQYAQDFATCSGYSVDIVTKKLVFSYPDPSNPETPIAAEKPITEQITDLKAENASLNVQIIDVWETLINGGIA